MPEFKRKDGSPLFASQIELNLSINGWDHKSLLFVPPADFDAKVYSDVYAESKEEINPAQAARFTESLANAPVPYLVYDSAAGLWTLGTELAAPPVLKDSVLAKAREWKALAGGRLTAYHRWDRSADGMAAGRFSRILCGQITPCEPTWNVPAYNSLLAAQSEEMKGTPFFNEQVAIDEFVASLGLVPSEWVKINSLYGLNNMRYNIHEQHNGNVTGSTIPDLIRTGGACERGYSYILTPPDMFGNCALLQGPLCDFAFLVMTKYRGSGIGGSGNYATAPIMVKADGTEVVLPGPTIDNDGKGGASGLYEGPVMYGWDGSLTLGGPAPSLSLATDLGILVGAETPYVGQAVYKLSAWRWALNGFTEWAFRDMTNLVRVATPHTLSAEVRAVHAQMPVVSFRQFIDAAGRDKNGVLLPELAKARSDLATYIDGMFMVTVHEGQRALSKTELETLPIVQKVRKAGKMDEDLGRGATIRKGIATLDKACIAQKDYTSFARLHDESVDVGATVSAYVQSLVSNRLAGAVVVTASAQTGGLTTYAMSGAALGAISEVEAQWLVAHGATLAGSGIDASAVEESWELGDGWREDLRDFRNVATAIRGRPVRWLTPFVASGDSLSITDVCDRNGFPLLNCNLKVKQLICKGLSQDGSEQLALPLFISPASLISDTV